MSWWKSSPLAEEPAPQGNQYNSAIASIESGGNYGLLGPVTKTGDRAYGKYQVMGSNIGPWSEEALGRRLTAQEFISNPDLQDAVFNHRFGQYVKKYGPNGAARAWFAGEGGMNDMGRKDQLGTSVASYGQRFDKALGGAANDTMQPPSANWWKNAPLADEAAPKSEYSQGNFDERFALEANPNLESSGDQARDRLGDKLTRFERASGAIDSPLGRGVSRGGGMFLGDEAAAAGSAAGRFLKDVFTEGPSQAAKNAGQAYDDTLEAERYRAQLDNENNPAQSMIGEIIGSLGNVRNAGAAAETWYGRAVQGGKAGATVGGISGFGQGEGTRDRIDKGVTGSVVGAGIGTALPPLIEGAGSIIGGVTAPIRGITRGITNPDEQAARILARSLERDNKSISDVARSFSEASQAGKPAVLADVAGENTKGLARSVRNLPGEARDKIVKNVSERAMGQASRIQGDVADQLGISNAFDDIEAIRSAARAQNNANYKRINAAYPEVWNDELAQLTQAPAVQSAIKEALKTANNKMVAEGMQRVPNPFNLTENGVELAQGVKPSLMFHNEVKIALDDMVSEAYRSGKSGLANGLKDLRNTYRAALDRAAPGYKATRDVAAEQFGFSDAIEYGQDLGKKLAGKTRIDTGQVMRQINKLKPAERIKAESGMSYEVRKSIANAQDSADVVKQIFGTPEKRATWQALLGSEKFKKFETQMLYETFMRQTERAVAANSTTASQLSDMADVAGGADIVRKGLSGDVLGVVKSAVSQTLNRAQGINEKVATRLSDMLFSEDPRAVKSALDMVSKSRELMKAWRETVLRLTSSGNRAASPNFSSDPLRLNVFPSSQVPARAEKDEKKVPATRQ